MAIDIEKLEKLRDSGVKFSGDVFEVAQAMQILKTNGYEHLKGIKTFNDLIAVLGDMLKVENTESVMESEIRQIITEGKMIDKITLDYLVKKYEKEINTRQGQDVIEKLIRDYVEQFSVKHKVEGKVDEVAKKVVKELGGKEELLKPVKEVLKLDLEEVEIQEEKNITTEYIENELKKFDTGKDLLDKEINLYKEAENEAVKGLKEAIKIEDLSKEQEENIKESLKNLDPQKATEKIAQTIFVKDKEVIDVIKKEVIKFNENKNETLKKAEIIVEEGTKETGATKEEKIKYREIVYQKIIDLPVDPKNITAENKILQLITGDINRDLIRVVDDEFRRNVAYLGDKNFKENLYTALLFRKDIKDNLVLKGIIEKNRYRILDLTEKQVLAFTGESSKAVEEIKQTSGVEDKKIEVVLKKAHLELEKYKKENKELINKYENQVMKEVIQKNILNKFIPENKDQKRIIKNYSEFIAESFHPIKKKNLPIKDWLENFKMIKGEMIKEKIPVPYSLPIIRKTEKLANYFESRPYFLNRMQFSQNIENIFSRIGINRPVFENQLIFRNVWNEIKMVPTSGMQVGVKSFFSDIGSSFRGIQQGGVGGAIQSISNLGNNIGETLGKGFNKTMDGLGITPGGLKRDVGNALGKTGNSLLKNGITVGENLTKLGSKALAMATAKGVAVFLLLIIGGILLYSIFMSGSISTLVPPNTLAGQITPGEGEEGEEKDPVNGVCWVTRNIFGVDEKIGYLGVFGNIDRCEEIDDRGETKSCREEVFHITKCVKYGTMKKMSLKDCPSGDECYLDEVAYDAYKKLIKRIREELGDNIDNGFEGLEMDYAYRDYWGQIWRYCDLGPEEAAYPGNSPHMSGLAFDLKIPSKDILGRKYSYDFWKRYNWFVLWDKYARDYGFFPCIEADTCGRDEPWHWEFRNKIKQGDIKEGDGCP